MTELRDWQGRLIEPGATVYYPTTFAGRTTEIVRGKVLEVSVEHERDWDHATQSWISRPTGRPRVKIQPREGSRSGRKTSRVPAFPVVSNITVIEAA